MAPKKLTLNISKLKALTEDQTKTVDGGATTTCGTTFCPKSG